jgi:hypothetical protein
LNNENLDFALKIKHKIGDKETNQKNREQTENP